MDNTTKQPTDGEAMQVGLDLDKLDHDLEYILTCLSRDYKGSARETVNDIRARIASVRRAMQPGANAEPVARLHIRLDDDGLAADVEVLDGTYLQVEHSPVDVYLAPPASKKDAPGRETVSDNLLVEVAGLLRPLVEDGQVIRVKNARDVLYKVFAAQRAKPTVLPEDSAQVAEKLAYIAGQVQQYGQELVAAALRLSGEKHEKRAGDILRGIENMLLEMATTAGPLAAESQAGQRPGGARGELLEP